MVNTVSANSSAFSDSLSLHRDKELVKIMAVGTTVLLFAKRMFKIFASEKQYDKWNSYFETCLGVSCSFTIANMVGIAFEYYLPCFAYR